MSRNRIVILFPGQGSFVKGKNYEILNTPYARELDGKAKEVLGESLIEKIRNISDEDLRRTAVMQPVIFFLGLLTFLILKEEGGLFFVGAAGHSLGEVTALTASGFFSVKDGFSLVMQRAGLMEKECRKHLTGMLAVIGSNPLKLSGIAGTYGVFPANINSENQVVFAGELENLNAFREEVQKSGYRSVFLKVEGAFHTPFMENASIRFRSALDKVKLNKGSFPVFSNVDGKEYNLENLKDNLARQISSPVRWIDCMDRLNSLRPDIWVEACPGNVLYKFIPEDHFGDIVRIEDIDSINNLIKGA